MDEFKKADKKFDEIEQKAKTKVFIKKKCYMKISDCDPADSEWFKAFADEHTDKKQWLALKVIRAVMERMDPLIKNNIIQLNELSARVTIMEDMSKPSEVEPSRPQIPVTQGSRRLQ